MRFPEDLSITSARLTALCNAAPVSCESFRIADGNVLVDFELRCIVEDESREVIPLVKVGVRTDGMHGRATGITSPHLLDTIALGMEALAAGQRINLPVSFGHSVFVDFRRSAGMHLPAFTMDLTGRPIGADAEFRLNGLAIEYRKLSELRRFFSRMAGPMTRA